MSFLKRKYYNDLNPNNHVHVNADIQFKIMKIIIKIILYARFCVEM